MRLVDCWVHRILKWGRQGPGLGIGHHLFSRVRWLSSAVDMWLTCVFSDLWNRETAVLSDVRQLHFSTNSASMSAHAVCQFIREYAHPPADRHKYITVEIYVEWLKKFRTLRKYFCLWDRDGVMPLYKVRFAMRRRCWMSISKYFCNYLLFLLLVAFVGLL